MVRKRIEVIDRVDAIRQELMKVEELLGTIAGPERLLALGMLEGIRDVIQGVVDRNRKPGDPTMGRQRMTVFGQDVETVDETEFGEAIGVVLDEGSLTIMCDPETGKVTREMMIEGAARLRALVAMLDQRKEELEKN